MVGTHDAQGTGRLPNWVSGPQQVVFLHASPRSAEFFIDPSLITLSKLLGAHHSAAMVFVLLRSLRAAQITPESHVSTTFTLEGSE